ncbi:MAG: MATE family efflux transporter [Aureisphaera sp.]
MKLSSFFNSQQIRTSAIGSVAIKFLSALFALINGILLARMLTVKDFGIYVLAFTTVTVITIPVSLGLPHLLTRYISKYEITKEWGAMKGLLIRSNQFVLITSLLAVVIGFITYVIWWKQYPINTVTTFWYSFLLLPLLVFGALRSAALRGLKYVVLGQMPETFLRNMLFTVSLVTVYFSKIELTPQSAMLYHIVAAAIAFFIGYLFLKSKLLNRLKGVEAVFYNKFWLKEATPFSIISGVQVIKTKSITYVLAAFGSYEAVAIFDVALRGSALVSFTVEALNLAISPYISTAFEQQQTESLQRIVKKTARLVFVLSIPIALVLIFGGEWIIGFLFGSEYIVAYIPVVILCVGHIINTIVGPLAAVLNMTDNQKYLSKNQMQMMVLSIILSVPFVYFWDVEGAAVVFSLILSLQLILLVIFVKRKLKIDPTIF